MSSSTLCICLTNLSNNWSCFSYGVGLAEARVAQLRILVDEHRELLRKIKRDEMEEGEVRTLMIQTFLQPSQY